MKYFIIIIVFMGCFMGCKSKREYVVLECQNSEIQISVKINNVLRKDGILRGVLLLKNKTSKELMVNPSNIFLVQGSAKFPVYVDSVASIMHIEMPSNAKQECRVYWKSRDLRCVLDLDRLECFE
jgi:hypothetical protein